MERKLLLQRQEFMKNAIKATAPIKREEVPQPSSSTTYSSEDRKKKPKKKASSQQAGAASGEGESGKKEGISNAANFGMMAKIVDYMKKRHLDQKQWALSLREIIDEMKIAYEVTKKTEGWLKEALPKNPRLHAEEDGKLKYVPPYKVKNRATLLALLKKNHAEGRGGVLLSELNDCMPNIEQNIKSLENQVVDIPTQVNKPKDHVYFFNDPDTDLTVDAEFVALWRQAAVDHMDEKKIDDYLQKHGINTAKDLTPKRFVAPPKRKQNKRKFNTKIHNEHLGDILEDYGEF